MAWLDFLNNQYTYLLLFEVFVTFVSFGVFLGVFWVLGELPFLQFNMQGFLNDHGVVLFLTLFIYEIGKTAFNKIMQGM